MKTSIATVCISATLPEKLEAIAAAGFRAVEIFEMDLIAFPGTPRDVRKLCADLGLEIVTCQPFRDFEGLRGDRRAKAFDRAERKFDLLQELGTDLLFVCSTVHPEAQGGIDRLAEDFQELATRAAKRQLRVGYEALSWSPICWDYRDAWEVVRRADCENLGVILDTFHIEAREIDMRPIRTIPGNKIAMVHIADAPRLKMDFLSWGRHWRCMPGQGDFDMISFMEMLSATGYDGAISLEIFNDRFRAASPKAVAIDGHRSLIWLLDETARRIRRPLKDVLPLPIAAKVKDTAFIEFAVHEKDQPDFIKMLTGMGFTHTGSHRSKNVLLFEQGRIRIVVNSDASGFARTYQITHGTSVCAIAFNVPNARDTVARAEALLDTPHHAAFGPGELDIPAVRGLGGSLVYFVDDTSELASWADVDFIRHRDPGLGVGLVGVDHISQSMQYEEMLTWLLFYTSLFEAEKRPSQAVIDPGGVVQSQVIESGNLRLVLNGSQSQRTQSSRFVTDFFGSGVQHIALTTGNIAATVSAMRRNGVAMLPIPHNYYDDLAARTDLTAKEIAELKSLNVLYDSDAGGSFRHAYSQTLDGGFFFEIVEREDGHKGYGAPNATIRLAAQARFARPPGMPAL
jgi:4-hydroxyphenylpyruvate dioxygenase